MYCERVTRSRAAAAVILPAAFFVALLSARPVLTSWAAPSTATSPRWPQYTVIPVWIASQGSPPGSRELVEQALKTWTDAAAGRFRLVKAASEDAAAIRIHFLRADGVYGETAPQVDRRTLEIVEADVVINGDAAGDGLEGRIVVYLTALHEVGHALGLGHTDDFDTIMYSFRRPEDGERFFGKYRALLRSPEDIGSKRATGLSAADIRALRELYDR